VVSGWGGGGGAGESFMGGGVTGAAGRGYDGGVAYGRRRDGLSRWQKQLSQVWRLGLRQWDWDHGGHSLSDQNDV